MYLNVFDSFYMLHRKEKNEMISISTGFHSTTGGDGGTIKFLISQFTNS